MKITHLIKVGILLCPLSVLAQQSANITIAPAVVVTATRAEAAAFELPLAIDTVDAEELQRAHLGANISEFLNRIPGASVLNRETYAQEQGVTLRGFGARSQFGIRGIHLLADGIPASMPDGQGGAGLFDLDSAARIEVLRGPFSALYGNHSGGVIQVFTEDPPVAPMFSTKVVAGSDGTSRIQLKTGGGNETVGGVGSLSRLDTDGYRDWSKARKDQANVKLKLRPDEDTSLSIIGNYLAQPDNQDPLGLTAVEMAANRRQASPDAIMFKTRRTLDNLQGGVVLDTRRGADQWHLMAYAGNRSNEQYLSVPATSQNSILSAGAVSTYERDFQGLGGRWSRKAESFTTSLGADYSRAIEARKGYRSGITSATNSAAAIASYGNIGALKRNEDNTVAQTGLYGQTEWRAAADWLVHGGLRYTRVTFDSRDKFVCTTIGSACSGTTTLVSASKMNPDDSGSASFSAWTPVLGISWKLSPAVNLYANAGRSFETPTMIEMAYRTDGGSGLNFGLKPSISRHLEVGVKAFSGADTQVRAALYQIATADELVTFSSSGGRTTYQNAGKTKRRGIEFALDSNIGHGFAGNISASRIDARFRESFLACTGIPCVAPNTLIGAGNRIPGIPAWNANGDLRWDSADGGFSTGLEGRWSGRVQVNDGNTESTSGYFTSAMHAGFTQTGRSWKLSEFLRIDNLLNKEYVGAVYVNDANGRFYAPAAGRTSLLGIQLNLSL